MDTRYRISKHQSASIIHADNQQGSFMLVNDLRGLVIPASFSKDYSFSYSASIIPDGYQGPDQQASFMPVKDLRSW